MCKFNKAWIGICKQENIKGYEYCEEHLNCKCAICGNQATHDCAETMQFVCGANLCDSLECKLEHLYISHGYSYTEISNLEKILEKKTKIIVAKLRYETSSKFHEWYNTTHGEYLQLIRLVQSKDNTIRIYKTSFHGIFKEKSELKIIFENINSSFYKHEIKNKGIFYTDETIFLDKIYTSDTLPKLEKIEYK